MSNQLYIQEGVVSTGKKKGVLAQLFDMRKWTTNLLIDYGLLTADPCCVSGATGSNISNSKYSVFTGIVASGTTAADATVLDYGVNVIETASLYSKSVKLPQPVTGKSVRIINMSSIAIYVFPSNPGGKINNLPIDTPLAIPPDGATYEFICTENPLPGNWNSIVSPAGASSFVISVTINHTHGVADDIIVNDQGVITPTSTVSVTQIGGAIVLYPSSAAYFTLPQSATATYLKVYSNIIPSDLGPTYGDAISILRYGSYLEFMSSVYHVYTFSADNVVFQQSFDPAYISAVTTGPVPTSSALANIGDNTTIYAELPPPISPIGGGSAEFDQLGLSSGIAYAVSNVYSYYGIYIPASAATKDYKFYIVQEYV